MNKYEIMLIIKADVEEEARNAVIESLKNVLAADGTVDNVNEWGLRDFAYEIQKAKKGYYVVIDTTCTPAAVAEFDRVSRINANVVRHMIIRK